MVSAGGTRHVRRRKKNADGTYGDSESYHSSQDEDGEARRRKRRRDREHGDDSDHSYYSVVSAGGTRHVRRRKRNPDGTYGDSDSYHSGDTDHLNREITKTSKTAEDSESDYSYASEKSEGGTRYEVRRKRIRDAHGNVIGHADKVILGEATSDADSVRTRRGRLCLLMEYMHRQPENLQMIFSSTANVLSVIIIVCTYFTGSIEGGWVLFIYRVTYLYRLNYYMKVVSLKVKYIHTKLFLLKTDIFNYHFKKCNSCVCNYISFYSEKIQLT